MTLLALTETNEGVLTGAVCVFLGALAYAVITFARSFKKGDES